MLGTLFVVIESEKEEDYNRIKEQLMQINPEFSISPYKDSMFTAHAIEFYATFHIEEKAVDALLAQLNNDWDGEHDDCIAYGFNTRMFDPQVYYLAFQLYE